MLLLVDIRIGSERSKEVTQSNVDKWDKVWEIDDVDACVGGNRSGRGPRRSEVCRGACDVR